MAPLYNFGLLMAGFFTGIYAVAGLRGYAKLTSYALLISSFTLQLVATFDEVHGFLIPLYLFFVSLGVASILYAVEKRSLLAAVAFIVGLLSWVFPWMEIYVAGVAVPETISSLVTVLWVISSAVKVYRGVNEHVSFESLIKTSNFSKRLKVFLAF